MLKQKDSINAKKNFQNVQTFLPHIAMINENTSARLSLAVLTLDIVFGGFQALLPFFLRLIQNSSLPVQIFACQYDNYRKALWNLKNCLNKCLPLVTFKIQTVYIAFLKRGVSEKILFKKCCKSLFLAEQLCEMGGSRHIKTVQNYPAQRQF